MASLLISAAVNIGVGLLINFLFPPEDIKQEGPRLNDLDVTSSAYGQAIPIHYGTIRTGGNVFWSPGIVEVANTTTQEGGGKGGGGPSVSTTTYAYFASFALGFAEGVADDILRIWADGKLIYDKTGTGVSIGGVKFRFYTGSETQLPDSLMEADKGTGNVPGHRGLCYVVFDQLPLANFGNRIPNITAEITFNATNTLPWTKMTELSGMNIPGSSSGADSKSHMFLDPFSDNLYFLKGAATGLSRQSVGTFSTQVVSAFAAPDIPLDDRSMRYCMNGKLYAQEGSSNAETYYEREPDGLQRTGFSFGASFGLPTWGDPFEIPNGCFIGVLTVGVPEAGVPFEDVFVISNDVSFGGGPGGFVVIYDGPLGVLVQDNHITDTDIGRGGPVIQDFFNRRIFVTQESDTVVDLWEVTANLNVNPLGGVSIDTPVKTLVGSYSKGGVDYAGTADTAGWCVVPDEQALILSNGESMFKVDMDDGSVLARNLTLGFESEDQWTNTGLFGFGNGHSGVSDGGLLYTIDTEDLVILATQDLGLGAFDDGEEANYPKAAYDPRSHSLILSRQHGTTPSNGERIVRVLLQRGAGLGVGLDTIVSDLSIRAGLTSPDINVVGLAGEIVQGFSVTRQTPVRSAVEPLMRGFLFEGVESDFVMKFVRRGGVSALTLDPDFLGKLTTDANDEFIKEVRTQEVELPMRVSVRFADRVRDYQQGTQSDKRVQNPTASMESGEEMVLDLPIVMLSDGAKQLAQRWLYTTWAERATIDSVLPWKYIRLDPTDIFLVTYRGDVRRLRMSNLEVGGDLELSFSATQEDAETDNSSLPSDTGQDLTQVIPSGLPTKFLALDLPLLGAADASLQVFNRAYWAAAGYDATWPGSLLYQSLDDGISFKEVATAPVEAAWGVTKTVIPAPATTLTWDESATIDVQVARGVASFTSSTDLEVLNGDNAIAVDGPNGPEIIQFVNVVSVDASTVRLSRLLRGRRGTDIAALTGAHVAGEQVVLLVPGAIFTFQNPLSLMDVSIPFKGVTLNTLLEDAPTVHTIYTGQDLLPYAPSGLAASLAGGDVTLTWHRRTRFNGELRDGTGDAPLNEDSEAYEVDILDGPGGTVLRTLTATAETVVYDTTLDPVMATLLAPYDADADDDSSNAATGTLGAQATIQTTVKRIGAGCVEFSPSGAVDPSLSFVSYPDLAAYTIGTQPYTLEGWFRFKDVAGIQMLISHYQQTSGGNRAWHLHWNNSDSKFKWVVFDFIDRTLESSVVTMAADTWFHIAVTRDANDVTRMFLNGKVIASETTARDIDNSGTVIYVGKWRGITDDLPLNGFADDVRLVVGRVAYTEPFVPPIVAHVANGVPAEVTFDVYQMSEVKGRGRAAKATLTL